MSNSLEQDIYATFNRALRACHLQPIHVVASLPKSSEGDGYALLIDPVFKKKDIPSKLRNELVGYYDAFMAAIENSFGPNSTAEAQIDGAFPCAYNSGVLPIEEIYDRIHRVADTVVQPSFVDRYLAPQRGPAVSR